MKKSLVPAQQAQPINEGPIPYVLYSLSPIWPHAFASGSTVSRGHNSLVFLDTNPFPPLPPSIHPNHHGQKYLPAPLPTSSLPFSLLFSSVYVREWQSTRILALLCAEYEYHYWFDFLIFFMHYIQHCFICRPSDSTVSEDAEIEPRTVATSALTVRRSNHYRLDLIHEYFAHMPDWYEYTKHICNFEFAAVAV
jgi:hypothetical protein